MGVNRHFNRVVMRPGWISVGGKRYYRSRETLKRMVELQHVLPLFYGMRHEDVANEKVLRRFLGHAYLRYDDRTDAVVADIDYQAMPQVLEEADHIYYSIGYNPPEEVVPYGDGWEIRGLFPQHVLACDGVIQRPLDMSTGVIAGEAFEPVSPPVSETLKGAGGVDDVDESVRAMSEEEKDTGAVEAEQEDVQKPEAPAEKTEKPRETPSQVAVEETRGVIKDMLTGEYGYEASELEGMDVKTLSVLLKRERRLASSKEEKPVEPVPARPGKGAPGAVKENPELRDFVVSDRNNVNTTVADQGFARRAMEVFEAKQGKFPAPSRVTARDAAET